MAEIYGLVFCAVASGFLLGVWHEKKTILRKLESERERLLKNKMDGAEHILVHHGIRVIEETWPQ